MIRHIGIVGCSAEGAALCYRTICIEAEALLGEHAHPEVSIHTPSLARYVACLEHSDIEGVGKIMLESAGKLAAAGADFLIAPDNTIHQAFDYVQERSPLPWIHIADAVVDDARRRNVRCAAILGTKWLMESDVYPDRLNGAGIAWQRPGQGDRVELNRIIMDELVKGCINAKSVAFHLDLIERLKVAGADAVILGCTEIPLIVNDDNSALPTLDSTRLLARAALARAIATEGIP